MTTKEYLRQIYKTRRKIKSLQELCDGIRLQMAGISSPPFSAPVQTSRGDRMPALMDKLNHKTAALERAMVECLELVDAVTDQLALVEDDRLRLLLTLRYVQCKSWETIADEMDYDLRYIHRLHGKALTAFELAIKSHV